MTSHEYHPRLVTALRKSLERIEAEAESSQDQALTGVKSAIVRALGEHEVNSDSPTPAEQEKPKVVVLVLPSRNQP